MRLCVCVSIMVDEKVNEVSNGQVEIDTSKMILIFFTFIALHVLI